MSLAASLCHVEWQGRKINLIDTPGDSGFQARHGRRAPCRRGRARRRLRRHGRRGRTPRASGQRAEELGLSRVVFVNMLDRERADFFRTLEALQEQLSDRCVAIQLPIGAEHELTGIVDLLHICAYMSPEAQREGEPVRDPGGAGRPVGRVPREAARRRRRDRRGADGALPRGRGARRPRTSPHALKDAVTRGEIFPVALRRRDEEPRHDGAARPARRGRAVARRRSRADRRSTARAPPRSSSRRRRPVRRAASTSSASSRARSRPTRRSSTPATTRRSGSGSCCSSRARSTTRADAFGAGDIGAVAKLKDVADRRRAVDAEHDLEPPRARLPGARDELRGHAEGEGRRGEGRAGAPAAAEEDPTLALRRDPQTGEQLLAGHEPGARRGRGRRG